MEARDLIRRLTRMLAAQAAVAAAILILQAALFPGADSEGCAVAVAACTLVGAAVLR